DMQRMFAEPTEWLTPWAEKVLPRIIALVEYQPERTMFTRFIPVDKPGQGQGMWKHYYERWASMTVQNLGVDKLELVADLARFIPPASVIDKHVYGPWMGTDLHQRLQKLGVTTLIISGGETDVCVLATVLGAVDLGYRVVLAKDALCSSSDAAHDSAIDLYHQRYRGQVEPLDTDTILCGWSR
ncbi:MAG: isochorismatase family cysteine hydrolase, partial [Nitrospira sp.]